jgi:hypothetical protein
MGAPLQQLHELHIKNCSLQDGWPGSGSSSGRISDALQLLPQLPALHTLQLSSCVGMLEVPPAVLHCTDLTKLVLQNNELLTQLPAGISQLSGLQVRYPWPGCTAADNFSKQAHITLGRVLIGMVLCPAATCLHHMKESACYPALCAYACD